MTAKAIKTGEWYQATIFKAPHLFSIFVGTKFVFNGFSAIDNDLFFEDIQLVLIMAIWLNKFLVLKFVEYLPFNAGVKSVLSFTW